MSNIYQTKNKIHTSRNVQSAISTKKSLFLVYIAHCFRYVYSLILIPFYGRILGVEEYGKLLAALALYQILWLIIEYGCPVNGIRDLASTDDNQETANIFGQQFLARIYLLPIGLIIGFVAIYLSPVLTQSPLYGILAIALSIVSAFHIGWYFQGTFQFITQSILEFLSFLFSLILIIFFVKSSQDGTNVLLYLFAVSASFIFISYIIAFRQFGFKNTHYTNGITLIKKSTSLFISRGLNVLLMNSSSYLLSILSTAIEIGYYGPAEKFVLAGISFMQPVGQVLLGKITKYLSSETTEADAYHLMKKGVIGLILLGYLSTIALTVLSPYLIPLFLGKSFLNSVPIIQLLGFIFPFSACIQAITTYILIPLRKDHYVVKASFINILINVIGILYFVWIDSVSGMTFACVRVLAEMFSCIFLIFIILRLNLPSKTI